MYNRHRKLLIVILVVLITGSMACVTDPPPVELSIEPTVDIEATVEARLAQETSINATVTSRITETEGTKTQTGYPSQSPPTALDDVRIKYQQALALGKLGRHKEAIIK